MQYFLCVPLLLFTVFMSFACTNNQTVKDSWKFTTKQYRTYLNTPVQLDMDDKGSCEPYELALGEALLAVDDELQKLIRAMENSDHKPDQAWVATMMRRFPWLSGVALVDASGKLVAQYPEHFTKAFDVQPLMEPDPKQRLGALRAYVQNVSDEPEIYVANPVFDGKEMRGLVVAYFDPKSLITTSPNPGAFVIASPSGLIWKGGYGEGSIVAEQNWTKILQQKSCGIIGTKEASFFWTTRYVGNLPLVYAVSTSAGKSQEANPEPSEKADEKQAKENTKTSDGADAESGAS